MSALRPKAVIRGRGGKVRLSGERRANPIGRHRWFMDRYLVRPKLSKQIVPVVFNPVFRELVAFKSADDDHSPLCLAARCGNSLPLLTLRGIPSPPPHAFVA